MKRIILMLALAPSLALAAPKDAPRGPGAGGPGGSGGPGGPEDAARMEHAERRMRLARMLGLAEVLELDDAGALKLRDALARQDQKAAPLRKQLRDSMRVLRDAAHGDGAAAVQVDGAIQRAREARSQLQALDADLLQQITQGVPAQKKARAALFLAHFGHRASHMAWMQGPPRGGRGFGGGPGAGPGPGGEGMGPHAMMMGPGPEGPDLDEDGVPGE